MCGIFFIFDKDKKISEKLLNKTINQISYRGPDNQSIFIENNVGMAHARLSIIDLSPEANQPFASLDNNYIIIYNGEIYNFQEIKEELIKEGIKFKTNSDTEVLLNSYIFWGESFIKKLNGMFAFVIFDKKSKEVFVGRDRFGVKPLYYFNYDNLLIFSSEIKGILNYLSKVEINTESIYEYFVFQNLLRNKTFFKNINIFPHGCFSKFNIKNSKHLKIKRYWDFCFLNESSNSNDLEKIDFLLRNSIKKNLVADVTLAFYLSSGLDSTLINVIANNYCEKLNTYSCGFSIDNQKLKHFDESKQAKKTAKLLNSNHNTLLVSSDDNMKYLDKLVYHQEDLKLGQSYPNYLIAKEVSKKHKIVISGAGGDELFAGYIWRYDSIFQKNRNKFLEHYFKKCQRVFNIKLLSAIFNNYDNSYNDRIRDSFYSYFGSDKYNNSEEDNMNQIQNFECKTFLQGYLNVEDKLSMANSLEARVPFLENDLFEYSMKLSHKHKLKVQNNSIVKGKLIIRKLLEKHISNVSKFKKQGFAAPDSEWYSDQLKKNSFDNFLNFKYSKEFINIDNLNLKINNFKKKDPHRFKAIIWNILNFEKLLKIYF